MKLIAAILFAATSILAVLITLPLPFVAPAPPGTAIVISGIGVNGWTLGLHEQNLQVPVGLLAGLTLGGSLGALSQLLYIGMGLAGLATFTQGGGWEYWQQPTVGYLLALVPATWITAGVAGRSASWGRLMLACATGIGVLHILGLPAAAWLLWPDGPAPWKEFITAYLLIPLPGQLLLAAGLALTVSLGRRTRVGRAACAPPLKMGTTTI